MKRDSWFRLILIVSLILISMILLANPRTASATPAPPGSDTVLIDHFEDATIANYVGGPLNYTAGPSGFGRAADFTEGNWVKYEVPGWYQWPKTYDASGKQGTVELWVYPMSYGISLVNFNWKDSMSSPSAGHILHLGIDAAGKLKAETWTAINGPGHALAPLPTGHTTLPLNQWTHVAFTWGDAGTRLYVNGNLDASTPDNLYPALASTFYAYVPYWGETGLGYIDELHILKTQVDYGQTPTTPNLTTNLLVMAGIGGVIVIGGVVVVGGVGLGLWLRRRRK
jgi:hypothetical protein